MSAPPPPHLDDLVLAAAADGEPEPHVAEHLAACAACTARLAHLKSLALALSATSLPGHDPRAADGVLARIGRRRSPRPAFVAALGALGGAAVMALVLFATRPSDPAGLVARGGEHERAIEVTPLVTPRAAAAPRVARPGDVLAPGFVLSFRAVKRGAGERWLMVYACDARGEIHWVAPDWQDPTADPSGVPLTADNAVYEPATGLAPDAAPGPLALVSLSTSAPVSARRVESLGPAACDPTALAALPDADVAVTSLVAERP